MKHMIPLILVVIILLVGFAYWSNRIEPYNPRLATAWNDIPQTWSWAPVAESQMPESTCQNHEKYYLQCGSRI